MKQLAGRCLALAGAIGLLSVVGCAHVDRARATYHEDRADRAAEHGRYIKAAREQRKANEAERDADHDPLP